MRKFKLLFGAILFSCPLFSQNVGIGTTIPAAKLDVKTTSNYVGQFNGASPMYMSIYENDVYRGYWGSYAGAAEDVDFGTGAGNTIGKLHFTIQAVPKMTINAAGQVGVGLTNPNHLLHVGGDLFVESSVGKIMLGYETGGSQWRLGTTGAGADIRWYTYNGTTETPMHYFQQNGNVGIGTGIPVPKGRLEVAAIGSTSSTNSFIITRPALGDTILRIRDDGRMGFGYNGTTYGRQVNIGGTGINFYTANEVAFGGAVFPTDTSLVLWSNSNANNYLVLQPSWGNTGIGTYTPNAKLHLNGAMLIGSNSARIATGYELSVDGEIMAEAVVTQPSGSWPDYVFEDDYRLMPLSELEKSIKENKHLPGMPSAAVINKTQEVNLGDMVTKLLEKVEELTLHVIDLKKENDALKVEVEKLKSK